MLENTRVSDIDLIMEGNVAARAVIQLLIDPVISITNTKCAGVELVVVVTGLEASGSGEASIFFCTGRLARDFMGFINYFGCFQLASGHQACSGKIPVFVVRLWLLASYILDL
jgi:hypothetical protein